MTGIPSRAREARLLADHGLSLRQIAARLGCSHMTVKRDLAATPPGSAATPLRCCPYCAALLRLADDPEVP